MDHHGLLTLHREINTVLTSINTARHTGPPEWKWKATPVIFPESHCPFCQSVIRSNGVWFFRDEPGRAGYKDRLVGAIFPGLPGHKVTLVMPSHPHDTGGGLLCLGRNASGIALLASTPYLSDSPMGKYNIPKWLKKYWQHDCKVMRDYLKAGYDNGHISNLSIFTRELDSI